jgi:hypothetical protein
MLRTFLIAGVRGPGDTAALAAAQRRLAKTWLGKPEGPALSSL